MIMGDRRSGAWRGVLSGLVFVTTCAGAYTGVFPIPTIDLVWSESGYGDNQSRYVPAARDDTGEEIVLVYIGSSTCAFSNAETLPETIERLKTAVQEQAVSSGLSFAAVGVAKDRRTAAI